MIISNNGTAFVSKKFEEFTRNNRIRHVKSAPYHPSTNGLVERAVQTFKMAMKKQSGTLQTRLCRFSRIKVGNQATITLDIATTRFWEDSMLCST